MVPDEGSEKLCKPLLKRDFPEFLKMSRPQICPVIQRPRGMQNCAGSMPDKAFGASINPNKFYTAPRPAAGWTSVPG